jgi:hypothetical protein
LGVLGSKVERYEEFESRHSEPRKVGEMGLFLSAIVKRSQRQTNSNIACTGEPGIGKSTFSLTCAEDLAPQIFVDHPEEAVTKFVTFTGSAFGRAIRDSPEDSIIIGDEFGQQMHHRKFMHDENISLSNVLQGFRFKKFKSFMNAPALKFFDADAQALITWMVNIKRRGVGQVYRVTHPIFNGTDFFHTFVDELQFRMPRPALWKAYVAHKVSNQEKVFDDSIRLMERSEDVPLTDEEIVKAIRQDPAKYLTKKEGKDDALLAKVVESRFGIGHSRAYRIIQRYDDQY